jgi:hypothetical protein
MMGVGQLGHGIDKSASAPEWTLQSLLERTKNDQRLFTYRQRYTALRPFLSISTMRLFSFVSALLFATIAESGWSSDGPTESQREESAPTGKLRVGVVSAPAQYFLGDEGPVQSFTSSSSSFSIHCGPKAIDPAASTTSWTQFSCFACPQ